MRHFFLLFSFLLPASLLAQVQYNDRTPETRHRTHAINFGAHLHSFGVGIDVQYRRNFKPQWDLLFEFSLAAYKDRNENRVSSLYAPFGGRPFIFDKQNYAYFMGFGFGGQYIIMPRSEFNRLQLSAGLTIGPEIALLKPYNLDIIRDNGDVIFVSEQYNGQRPEEVFGKSGFFDGFGNTTAQVGIKVRANVTLDLSGNSYFVRAIHFGFQYDQFFNEVPIMFSLPNQRSFLGGFVGLVIGNAWE